MLTLPDDSAIFLIMRQSSASNTMLRLTDTLFSNIYFLVGWLAVFLLALRFISWPIRNYLLVLWTYGRQAYATDGLRIAFLKPTRFSNGQLAERFPDITTEAAADFLTVAVVFFLGYCVLKIIGKHRSGTRPHESQS